MKLIRRLNVIVVTGKPRSGKSTFSVALGILFPAHKDNLAGDPTEKTAATTFRVDKAYLDFLTARGSVQKGKGLNIAKHFPDLPQAQRREFWEFLSEQLDPYVKSTVFTLIIEGWQADHYLPQLRTKLREHRVIVVALDGGRFRVAGKRFEIPRTKSQTSDRDNSFTHYKRALPANIATAAQLFEHLREEAIARLTAETTYQCFDDLGMDPTSSDSPAKFAALDVGPLLAATPGPKKVLDVGCQSGNFSLRIGRMSQRYRVVGIDTNRKAIVRAACYNSQVYELPNVEFRFGSALDFAQKNYDLVLAASVFHYFREQQQTFLDNVFELLKPGGYLVLECGVSREKEHTPHVQHFARGVDKDSPCYFPNRLALAEMTKRFELRLERPSVQQKGDPIPRTVFHLQKPSA